MRPERAMVISDYFRVFDNMEEGVKGYFELLQLPRYQNLKGITEPGRYLETIWADGYATSSVYVQKNMELIEQYQLTKYDENVSGRRAQDVLNVMRSWIGYSEANGKFRQIIDLYNSHQHWRGDMPYSIPMSGVIPQFLQQRFRQTVWT